MIIGARRAENNGRDGSGSTYVVYGPTPPPTPTPTPIPTPIPTPTPTPARKPSVAEVIPKPGEAIKLPSAKRCVSRKVVRIKFVRPPGSPVVRRIQVFLDGKSVKVVQGFVATATVNLKKLPTKRFTFKVVLTYASGKKLTVIERFLRGG